MKRGVADLFERPSSGTRALLVHAGVRGEDPERATEEFEELVRATGAEPVALVVSGPRRRDPRYFVGAGKAEELRERVEADAIELAIFNHRLTPAQERNLEVLLKCRVLDRIGLILDIFARRASTFEGASRSSSPSSATSRPGSCAGGPTWSGSGAGSAFAVRARRSSRPTGGSSASASSGSGASSTRSNAGARSTAGPGGGPGCRWSRSSATPTPASRPSSTG